MNSNFNWKPSSLSDCTLFELKSFSRLEPTNWTSQINALFNDLPILNKFSLHRINLKTKSSKLDGWKKGELIRPSLNQRYSKGSVMENLIVGEYECDVQLNSSNLYAQAGIYLGLSDYEVK